MKPEDPSASKFQEILFGNEPSAIKPQD